MKQKLINYFIKKYMENIMEKLRTQIRETYKGILSDRVIQLTIKYWEGVINKLIQEEQKKINKFLGKRFFEELEKDIKWVTVIKATGGPEEITSFNREKYEEIKKKLLSEI